MKLFLVTKPDLAIFGAKDAQQVSIIQRMVSDFLLDVDIVVAPTIREPDGLAIGSRNAYLGRRRRKVAACLICALRAAEKAY